MSDEPTANTAAALTPEQEHAKNLADSIALARANARHPNTKRHLSPATALALDKIGIVRFDSEEEAAAAKAEAKRTGKPIEPNVFATIETVFDKVTKEILSQEVIEEPTEQIMANPKEQLLE